MPNREVKRWAEQYVMDDDHGGGVTYPATGGTSDIYEGNTPKAPTQDQPDVNNAGGNTIQGYTVNGYTVPDYQYGSWSYNPYQRSGFSYKDAPEYINRYQEQIDNLANQIQHWQGFSYNYNTDPLYQQYAEAYNRNGQNAMRNTLAQMAARTGGMASSYAGTAAQNAYNEYMQGLNDKIPELYQLAYGMYNDRLNKQRNDLSMLEALEQGDYAKYVDLLNQYNTDRNMAYNVWNTTEGAREDADRAKAQYDYNVWKAQQDNAYDVWSMQQNAAYNTWKAQNDANYAAWKYQQDQAAADKEYEYNLALQRLKNQQTTNNGGKTKEDGGKTGEAGSDGMEEMKNLLIDMKNSDVPADERQAVIDDARHQGLISADEAEALSIFAQQGMFSSFNYKDWLNSKAMHPEETKGGNTGSSNTAYDDKADDYYRELVDAEKKPSNYVSPKAYTAEDYGGGDYGELLAAEKEDYGLASLDMAREYKINQLKEKNPGAYNRLMEIIDQINDAIFNEGAYDVSYRSNYIDKYLKAYGIGG